jgi:hypothetical protein
MTASGEALHAALDAFTRAAAVPDGPERLRARLEAAASIRGALAAGPVVPVVRTLPLVTGPIPRRPALGESVQTRAPFVRVRHRGLLIQCLHEGVPRTLLWNPTDVRHALAIPAFDAMRRGAGRIAATMLTKVEPPVPLQVAQLGVHADAVEVLAYDQMDAQYPAAMLARFPRARVALTQDEWERIEHPTARDAAFIVHGPEIDRARVQLVDDWWIAGDGAVLLRTGGRRPGHLSLVLHTARGVMVCSGNALMIDGYTPTNSRVPGLSAYAHARRVPFVGAYPEVGREPREAMAIEYALADRHPEAPAYPFIMPTVELVSSPIAPGVAPDVLAPDLSLGTIARF